MTIYTISKQEGIVYALQVSDGTLLWQQNIGQKLTGALAASISVIYTGSYDGYVYAMQAYDGSLLWRYSTGSDVPYPPMRTDTQSVYFGSPGGIYALRARDGSLLWHFSTPGCKTCSNAVAAISDGIIYAFLDGLYALRASDGQVLWYDSRFRLTPAYLVVMNRKVYVPTGKQDQLCILRANDGQQMHLLPGGNMIATDGMLYVNNGDKELYAVNTRDDALVWRTSEVTLQVSAASNETIYSTSSAVGLPSMSDSDSLVAKRSPTTSGQTNVYGLRANDGSLKWHWQLPYAMGISSHPLIVEGNIVFITGGVMYTLRESDGSELWHSMREKPFSSDPVGI